MLKLRDIMTRDVVSATPDMTIRDAMQLLSERHLSGAPVVDKIKRGLQLLFWYPGDRHDPRRVHDRRS